MKCPGVHCPGCGDMAGIGAGIVMIIGGAILYANMDKIAAALQLMAEIIVVATAVIVASIITVITVKIRNRRRIYAIHSPANRQEYLQIRSNIIRAKLRASGIVKTIPVSVTHTMKEIPPKMSEAQAEIVESSHYILPRWGRERVR